MTRAPEGLEPELAECYRQCADKNVLAALNPKIFFGYFSVCADPSQGHGHDTTFPGLDWGQSAEALLWLGRRAEVMASWDYVKGFLREDGLMRFELSRVSSVSVLRLFRARIAVCGGGRNEKELI